MKRYAIINTTTDEKLYVTAKSFDHIEAYVIKNMPDWYFGMNIVEVNADKTVKKGGDFLMNAVRDYYTATFKTNDDKKILNEVYGQIVNRIKAGAAF